MNYKYEIKLFNAGMVLLVYLLVGVYSCSQGQALQRICQTGYEASFGFHQLSSRAGELNLSSVSPISRGISVGYFFGNNLLKTRIRSFGYYEASSVSPSFFRNYQSEILLNLYPLEFIRTRKNVLDIYLSTGIIGSRTTFGKNSDTGLRTISSFGHTVGAGLEYLLRQESRMINVFFELHLVSHYLLGRLDQSGSSVFPSADIGVRIGKRKTMQARTAFQ